MRFTELGDRSAATRLPEGTRRFYGWAVLSVADASRSGRRVVASPKPQHPHHADIVLPVGADEETWFREAMRHAEELAEMATYQAAMRAGERPVTGHPAS